MTNTTTYTRRVTADKIVASGERRIEVTVSLPHRDWRIDAYLVDGDTARLYEHMDLNRGRPRWQKDRNNVVPTAWLLDWAGLDA